MKKYRRKYHFNFFKLDNQWLLKLKLFVYIIIGHGCFFWNYYSNWLIKSFEKFLCKIGSNFFFFLEKCFNHVYLCSTYSMVFFFFLHIFVLRAYYERVNIHFSYVRLSYLFCKIRYYLLNSRTNLLRVRMYTRYYTYYRVIVNQLDVINKWYRGKSGVSIKQRLEISEEKITLKRNTVFKKGNSSIMTF